MQSYPCPNPQWFSRYCELLQLLFLCNPDHQLREMGVSSVLSLGVYQSLTLKSRNLQLGKAIGQGISYLHRFQNLLANTLSSGEFGIVYKGSLTTRGGSETVAVKTLKG